ncbi:hypothetical protein SZN_07607 [Streptomyces zinciresistens K42]|uniref:Resolvase/invertase-type recombinase catalytic domain-containing protein n=1 Tax=Streptomyces zinciresistens K42 TaxID=700597 RepID=G2G7Q8_9ACTN|nr:hypothetical protein [Streptomyces zinciresistens]EGX60484.1 hypothetical protein SZN_07607 [Streptomyces zinciresistens K42]
MARVEPEPAYGYLRVIDLPDGEVELLEKQLDEYAKAHNLVLLDVRKERYRLLRIDEFTAWLIELEVQHLVVPSVEHITTHPIARMLFCQAVYLDAGVELYEAGADGELLG